MKAIKDFVLTIAFLGAVLGTVVLFFSCLGVLSGCASQEVVMTFVPTTAKPAGGFQISTQYTDRPAITKEYVLNLVYMAAEEFGDERLKMLDGWVIMMTDSYLKFDFSDEEVVYADGFANHKHQIIYVTVHDCIWDTSLIHELAHVMFDIGHADRMDIWLRVSVLERALMMKCPERYQREGPSF